MPKSGSTFLSDIICALPDFKRAKLAAAPSAGRQPELDVECLKLAESGNFVGQVHVLQSEWTAKFCKDFRLKPVVLVRSLPDAIVSLRDHVRREGGDGSRFFDDLHGAELDDAQLEAMLARFRGPWYVDFYMGWRTTPDALMISYEELTADPEGTLRRIVDFAGATVDDRAIAQAIAAVRKRGESRFNVGVAGRGAKLRPEILRELVGLFDFYPEAADDPYVKGVRAQVEAALAGQPLPRLGPVALLSPPVARADPTAPTPFRADEKSARRYGYQATLIATGLLYWVWPKDIIRRRPLVRTCRRRDLRHHPRLPRRAGDQAHAWTARPADLSFATHRPPPTEDDPLTPGEARRHWPKDQPTPPVAPPNRLC